MSAARAAILERLRNGGAAFAAGSLAEAEAAVRRVPAPPAPSDPETAFGGQLRAAGGRLQVVTTEPANETIEWPVPLAELEHVYSGVPEVTPRGLGLRAAEVPVHALHTLDCTVIRAEFGVAENGAIWHAPRSAQERAAILLAEHLVVLLAADAIVPSLHQAYARIDLGTLRFGWFLAGPSKTADIEQALVLGAHGPRSLQVVLHPPRPAETRA